MLIHVVAVNMVQMPIVEEVDVIAVRDARVITVGIAVQVAGMGVADGVVSIGISRRDLKAVIVIMIVMGVVQMSIMEIIYVAIMGDLDVSAITAVLMGVCVGIARVSAG